MAEPGVPDRDFSPPMSPHFRILAIDGGGIRGLIPALVLERLETLIKARSPGATLASSFDLVAGTSTGGLIALGLTTPGENGEPALDPTAMVDLYTGPEVQEIFDRPDLEKLPGIRQISDLADPRYGLEGLERALTRRFGERTVSEALTGLLTSLGAAIGGIIAIVGRLKAKSRIG